MINIEELSLNDDQLKKMKNLKTSGDTILTEIDDLRESLKDQVKELAEELDIKPTLLRKAINAYHKQNLQEQTKEISDVEAVLQMMD